KPKSILDSIVDSKNILLYRDKPYVVGNNSNKCKEEVDCDLEIDKYYKNALNEYDSNVANDNATDFEGCLDLEFEGFLDSNSKSSVARDA
ncbi:hypothetical protein CC86DRAFT_281207, partial [Ophiobolus disseminans]